MTPALYPACVAHRLRAALERLRPLVLDPSYTHPTFAALVLSHSRDYAPAS